MSQSLRHTPCGGISKRLLKLTRSQPEIHRQNDGTWTARHGRTLFRIATRRPGTDVQTGVQFEIESTRIVIKANPKFFVLVTIFCDTLVPILYQVSERIVSCSIFL